MKKIGTKILATVAGATPLLAPRAASAHEMYVLSPGSIASGMAAESPNPFSAIRGHETEFVFWGFVTFVVVSTIALATLFRAFEKNTAPFFNHIKRYALPLVRIGVGACLVSFGYHGALFGPEFPLAGLFGGYADIAEAALLALGLAVLAGVFVRHVAIVLIALWFFALARHGVHVLNYTDFLGAFVVLLSYGAGTWSIDHLTGAAPAWKRVAVRLEPYAFPILRMCFGFGVAFAAVYAKYLHSQLALDVVVTYHLTDYFRFDPLFVVLGALIIEFLAGAMMFLGVAIRWTGVFLLFWLTLSQLYFAEAVWPHLILFFLGLALFCHGYDRYSLEGRLLKRKGSEPVL